MTETLTTAPVTKSIVVGCDRDTAFQVFTHEIGTWWPTETHSINAGEVREVVWEEREGGEVYEISVTGERCRWATVLTWEPPHRLVIAWQVNPDRLGTEVEVRFTPEAGGTRVELEHRGWESLTDSGAMRRSYDTGWDHVLERFTARLA